MKCRNFTKLNRQRNNFLFVFGSFIVSTVTTNLYDKIITFDYLIQLLNFFTVNFSIDQNGSVIIKDCKI